MADEKDTEASRLALEKFIPEFNRLSVEGPTNDDDDVDGGRPPPPKPLPMDPPKPTPMPPPRPMAGYFDPLDEGHEFGRDTNRLDYFRVSPFEVSYDSAYGESDYYGGGTSHTGQQESAPTINFDTSDLRPTDSNILQEETIPNIGLGTIKNVHAENTDIGQDNNTMDSYPRLMPTAIKLGKASNLLSSQKVQQSINIHSDSPMSPFSFPQAFPQHL